MLLKFPQSPLLLSLFLSLSLRLRPGYAENNLQAAFYSGDRQIQTLRSDLMNDGFKPKDLDVFYIIYDECSMEDINFQVSKLDMIRLDGHINERVSFLFQHQDMEVPFDTGFIYDSSHTISERFIFIRRHEQCGIMRLKMKVNNNFSARLESGINTAFNTIKDAVKETHDSFWGAIWFTVIIAGVIILCVKAMPIFGNSAKKLD